jgi:hypothetical protein
VKIIFRTFLPIILSGLIACAPLNTLCADDSTYEKWLSPRYIVPAFLLATAATLAGLFLWENRNKLFSTKLKKSITPFIELNKPISVGSAACKGDERQWSKNVTVKQVRVQNQSSASCGYHALKNAILIANELTEPSQKLYENLQSAQLTQKLFGKQGGTWRTLVIERQKDPFSSDMQFDGEWIRGDALDHIINHESKYRKLLHPRAHVLFDTIDNIGHMGSVDLDHVTARVKANIKAAKAAKKAYVHCFLVNMPGHWITIVLYQKPHGDREYIITDSVNYAAYLHDDRIDKFIKTIEK